MVQLLKSKIEGLDNKNSESLKDLNKYLGAAIFIVRDDARSVSPIQPEYVKAISTLSDIQESKETDFDKKKASILSAINTLIADKEKWNDGKPDVDELMYGKSKVSKMNELEFELLMVEQNNIDFFKERESHLPSQPHDRLSSHMLIHFSGNNVNISYISSDLPESIKDEINSMLPKIGLTPQQK